MPALPEQAPNQLTKTLPALGVCVSVTLVVSAYACTQEPFTARNVSEQAIPSGALVIVPPPSEPEAAVNVSVGGAANCAVTATIAPVTIVSEQETPLHEPV